MLLFWDSKKTEHFLFLFFFLTKERREGRVALFFALPLRILPPTIIRAKKFPFGFAQAYCSWFKKIPCSGGVSLLNIKEGRWGSPSLPLYTVKQPRALAEKKFRYAQRKATATRCTMKQRTESIFVDNLSAWGTWFSAGAGAGGRGGAQDGKMIFLRCSLS